MRSKKYYIADLHLFHNAVLKNGHFQERPFETMDEMVDVIKNNWNKTVNNGDMVYILGDVGHRCNPSQLAEILSQLKGQITLITGNHDGVVVKDLRLKKQFVAIYDYHEIIDIVDGKQVPVVLSHYPMFSWKGQFRGDIHLYGHVHNNDDGKLFKMFLKESDKHFAKRDGERHIPFQAYNVGCMMDYMNYTPRTLEEIINANKQNIYRV